MAQTPPLPPGMRPFGRPNKIKPPDERKYKFKKPRYSRAEYAEQAIIQINKRIEAAPSEAQKTVLARSRGRWQRIIDEEREGGVSETAKE